MTKAPSAAEKRHLDRISQLPCLVCEREALIHHVTSTGYARITRTHRLVTPLCHEHHAVDFPYSVHRLGHREFSIVHGINLYHWAVAEWEKSEKAERERLNPPHWKQYA